MYDTEKRKQAREIVKKLAENPDIAKEFTLGDYDPLNETDEYYILGEFYPATRDPEEDVCIRIYIDGCVDLPTSNSPETLAAILPALQAIAALKVMHD